MSKPLGRNRRPATTVTTKSGKSITVNRSLSDRAKARKASQAAQRAAYLATLPKDRWKRIAYRLHPKRQAQYWFSREGGIMALKIIGISIVAGFFLTIGLFAYFRKDLPQIKDLSGDSLGGNITYYDRSGQTVLFNDYNSVKRLPVDTKEISPYVRQATIAIEDKDFYKHGAFDVRGIMRAAYRDVTGGSGRIEGGSTITQQLVKLDQNWTNNRTITRKVKELILAVELEREYSKDEILTGYLNLAPYGGQLYGVEAAAKEYFHVSAKDLTLTQAAMLAAIPQSPAYYSPYAGNKYNPAVTGDTFNPGALIGRMYYILDQMAKQGYITKQQASDAKNVDILAQIHQQSPKFRGIKAPYFVLAAKQELEQTYGAETVQRGGWKVITTMDMDLQNKAEQLVASNLRNISRYGANEEAIVAEDVETGQIVSLVGGTDFENPEHGQNNYAAGILIPPGSSFKPYDYAALIDNNNNVGAGSVLYDSQGPLPGYPCTNKNRPKQGGNCLQNYDFRYPGPITLRYALGGSRNVPAVKAMLSTVPNDKSNGRVDSINKTINTASAMMYNTFDRSKKRSSYNCYADEALTQTTQCFGSAAMGDGAFLHLDDHVNGLATLSRLGKAIPRTYILKITDSAQKTVYEWKQPKGKQVIKADTAYIVNDMAADPRASYLPGGYKFHRYKGWNFAVKTGTTNDGYDGLMTAWSSKYAVVSWVGHHTRRVTLRSSMENLTAPLTRGWMEYAHSKITTPAVNWKQPTSIKTSPAFVVRSHVGIGSVEPSSDRDLYPGWYAGGSATSRNTTQTIDKVSNKVATSCTPPLARSTAANANAASWNADIFMGGRTSINTSGNNRGSTGTATSPTDDVHNCNDSPPAVTLTTPNSCDGTCVITATITQGTHPLSDARYAQFPGTVGFTLNGQTIHTANVSESPTTVSFTYKPAFTGGGTITATVTDSVLYQGTASSSLNFSQPPTTTGGSETTTSPTIVGATASGSNTTISWTGGSAPFTVYRVGGGAICTNVNANSCTPAVAQAPPSSQVYVRDSEGRESAPATVGP